MAYHFLSYTLSFACATALYPSHFDCSYSLLWLCYAAADIHNMELMQGPVRQRVFIAFLSGFLNPIIFLVARSKIRNLHQWYNCKSNTSVVLETSYRGNQKIILTSPWRNLRLCVFLQCTLQRVKIFPRLVNSCKYRWTNTTYRENEIHVKVDGFWVSRDTYASSHGWYSDL